VHNALLVAVSVGLPIGLTVYLAWVHRDWPGKIQIRGFATVVTGSLVGARLGFHATEGLAAVITMIVGGVLAANLILIVLDVVRERSSRHRGTPTDVPNTSASAPAEYARSS
jgi:hypothetical protein